MNSDSEKTALYAAVCALLLLMVIMLWFTLRLSDQRSAAPAPTPPTAAGSPEPRQAYAAAVSSALTRYETDLAALLDLLTEYELNPLAGLDADWVADMRGAAYRLQTTGFFIRHLTPPAGMEPLQRSLLAVESDISSAAGALREGPSDRFTGDLAPILRRLNQGADHTAAFVRLLKSRNWTNEAEDPTSTPQATVTPTATPTLGAVLPKQDAGGIAFPTPTP